MIFDLKHKYRLWGILLVATVLLLAACTGTRDSEGGTEEAGAEQPAEQEILYYTCGMHPWIVLPEPGLCPVCHMDLTPIE